MIEEIEIRGNKYRGIFGCPSANTPWKITWCFKGDWNWRTWKKFETMTAAEAAWNQLKADRDYELSKTGSHEHHQ